GATTQMSDVNDQRAVVAKYIANSSNSIGPTFPGQFNTKVVDTHNAVTTGSGWKFTAPVSGYYLVLASTFGSTTTTLTLYKNGVQSLAMGSMTATEYRSGVAGIELNAGDYIDVRAGSNNTLSGSGLNHISITKIANPTQVGATETVAARAPISATSLSGPTQLNLDTPILDTHGAIQNNTFIAPAAGIYELGIFAVMQQGNYGGGQILLGYSINDEPTNYFGVSLGTVALY